MTTPSNMSAFFASGEQSIVSIPAGSFPSSITFLMSTIHACPQVLACTSDAAAWPQTGQLFSSGRFGCIPSLQHRLFPRWFASRIAVQVPLTYSQTNGLNPRESTCVLMSSESPAVLCWWLEVFFSISCIALFMCSEFCALRVVVQAGMPNVLQCLWNRKIWSGSSMHIANRYG